MRSKLTQIFLAVAASVILSACTIMPIPIPVAQGRPAQGEALQRTPNANGQHASGYATPEDAITAYMQALAAADLDALLATASPQRAARAVDFVAYVERLRAYAAFSSPLPAHDDTLVRLNRHRLEQQLLNQINNFIVVLLTGEPDIVSTNVTVADREWAEEFAQRMDLARLADIQLHEIAPPDPELMADERYLQNAANAAAVWGGDDWTERLIYFTFEGEDYLLGFTLIRYGEEWYIQSQTSPLGGTDSSGAPLRQ